ncbi:methionine salvage haloacid dehalogenase-like hydrolase [Schizosaccharomyces cryophilus OY26]|uniref:Methionine salvage haloacid dehalogenase-like hydrolase n=1 Tax=Schizosaccharomyces cryophilus (strain OY26 / ATCC MYA-4695 / CBS 11777 / NBRC 106824 / NRRL Y48691) TaxID=653667 RepID=S9W3N0_SCHCR|nr:methionine salvage haloacid dehalogenase-like hydrolase [Schizosaccharomyces cryophilus OY26]EPY52550.1 methionine salvage haloacid dehalogenase-like hydrolase [Schizosaccharomyces cryophilus OY26]
MVKNLLLDIEGTVGSISFVKENLFSYAEKRYKDYVEQNYNSDEHLQALGNSPESALSNIQKLHAEGSKQLHFKHVQGSIWKDGYQKNELVSHLFPDVIPAIERALQSGAKVYIYSSGSVPAQKMYFAHTASGNILSFFSGFYDTNVGLKTESSSYKKIIGDSNPREWLFLSDNIKELQAAQKTGLHVGLVVRPGNDIVSENDGIPVYHSFDYLFTE